MTRKQDNRSTREVTTAQLRAATRPLRGGTVRRAARRAHAAAWRACDANAASVCLEAYRSPRGRPAGWPRAARTAGGHGDDGGVRGPWTRLRVCAARVTSTTGVAFQARAACEQAARQRRSCTARARAGRRGAWAANEHGLAACAAMHLAMRRAQGAHGRPRQAARTVCEAVVVAQRSREGHKKRASRSRWRRCWEWSVDDTQFHSTFAIPSQALLCCGRRPVVIQKDRCSAGLVRLGGREVRSPSRHEVLRTARASALYCGKAGAPVDAERNWLSKHKSGSSAATAKRSSSAEAAQACQRQRKAPSVKGPCRTATSLEVPGSCSPQTTRRTVRRGQP